MDQHTPQDFHKEAVQQPKLILLKACMQEVDDKIAVLNAEFSLYSESAAGETKSTAGDKHDTAKSMMQYEQEKMGAQLKELKKLKQVLMQIQPDKVSNTAVLGSLVRCKQMHFFLAVSSKPLVIQDEIYMPLSVQSPLGKLMFGQSVGHVFEFNGKSYEIIGIE